MSANLGGFISANFDPLSGKPTTVEYLVVAGGVVVVINAHLLEVEVALAVC